MLNQKHVERFNAVVNNIAPVPVYGAASLNLNISLEEAQSTIAQWQLELQQTSVVADNGKLRVRWKKWFMNGSRRKRFKEHLEHSRSNLMIAMDAERM